MKKSKIIAVLLSVSMLIVLALSLSGCGQKTYKAEMVIKDYGTITLILDATEAPITVKNFVKLAKRGAYDGTYFVRMQAGFVLQGGAGADTTTTIKGEFAANGVENNIIHKKGVISMARTGDDYNSASATFFIVLGDSAKSSLDGQYAAFGEVTGGWDVVEAICGDITADSYTNDFYGVNMGFLKESEYIIIETVRIVK